MEANKFSTTNKYEILWISLENEKFSNIVLLNKPNSYTFDNGSLIINKENIICEKNIPEVLFVQNNNRIYSSLCTMHGQILEFENNNDAKLYFELI